jgi:hypothetical protein
MKTGLIRRSLCRLVAVVMGSGSLGFAQPGFMLMGVPDRTGRMPKTSRDRL